MTTLIPDSSSHPSKLCKIAMAKGNKIKLSRVITPFQICRSKNPSSLVDHSILPTHKQSPFNPKSIDINDSKLPSPPPSTPEINHSFKPKGHVSFNNYSHHEKLQEIGYSDLNSEEFSYDSLEFAKKQDLTKWAAAKAALRDVRIEENKSKKKDKAIALSEAEENDQETGTYLFSGSFRYDTSCEFNKSMVSYTSEESNDNDNSNNTNNHKDGKEMKIGRKLKRQISKSWTKMRPQASVMKSLMPCTDDGKVRESVAVVKKSENPYEDFKMSMLEMILERQMFEAKDLEELLHCFLTLNSRQYYGVIVEAFSDIWEVLFCASTEHSY